MGHFGTMKRSQMGMIRIHESDFVILEIREIQNNTVALAKHREGLVEFAQHREIRSANWRKSELLVIRPDQQVVGRKPPFHEVGAKSKTIERSL